MSGDPGSVHVTSPDALSGLADIAVPDPVSWFPHTWGWGVVGTLLLVAVLIKARRPDSTSGTR